MPHFLISLVVLYSGSASAWTVAQLGVSRGIQEMEAFDRRGEEITARRTQVLRELREDGQRAAALGIAYSLEQWKSLATEYAGGRLSLYVPSDEALTATLSVQNQAAERTKQLQKGNTQSDPSRPRSDPTTDPTKIAYWTGKSEIVEGKDGDENLLWCEYRRGDGVVFSVKRKSFCINPIRRK